jgi:hypothetical protein
MLDQTIASYTETNMNLKRSVLRAMLVGTNGMMTLMRLRKITAVRGNDGRGRIPMSRHSKV